MQHFGYFIGICFFWGLLLRVSRSEIKPPENRELYPPQQTPSDPVRTIKPSDLFLADLEASALQYKAFRNWQGPENLKRHYIATARKDIVISGAMYRHHKRLENIQKAMDGSMN